ncbi:FtsK/SpoIIIE domain-containing protein [Nocardia sp. NPDC059240]|uniref:FtsK/SpoIIIE domain-containing protein n=1 Tax=Nocardia sp. NPDC059240 TaxID=3346786 RepID=UPI0036CD8553
MGELIGILILVAIAMVLLGVATAYYTAENLGYSGATGVTAVLVVLVLAAALIIWAKWSARLARERAEAAEVADWAAWVLTFHEDLQDVVTTLSSPWEACKKWTKVGLGRLPDPAKGDPGEYPELVASTNSYPADRGLFEVPVGLRLRIAMTDGQERKHYEEKLARLAVALEADAVRVVAAKGRQICLDIRYFDPIADPVPVPVPVEPVDLAKLNAGMRDDGDPWPVPLDERNILGVGEPGSGKSGFVRAMVCAASPAARDGYLVNIMIDLKFGVEAAKLRKLLHGTATSEEAALGLLRWLRRVAVEQRGRHMERHGLDKHVPTYEAPFFHLIIDEIAELLDNPETRKEFLRLLISIGRLGRALKFSMSAYTQLANKQILDMLRDLFQVRVGMRLNSAEQMVMVYGDHRAHERGADNTTIPISGAQGVAYVVDDTSAQIVRVRAYQVTTENLEWFAQHYPPARHPELEAVLAEITGTATGSSADTGSPMAAATAEVTALPERKRRWDSDELPELPEVFAEIDEEAEALSNKIGEAIASLDPEEWPVGKDTAVGSAPENADDAQASDATVLPLQGRRKRGSDLAPVLPGDPDGDQDDVVDLYGWEDDGWDDLGGNGSGDETA